MVVWGEWLVMKRDAAVVVWGLMRILRRKSENEGKGALTYTLLDTANRQRALPAIKSSQSVLAA
jgi:hypothetical protein